MGRLMVTGRSTRTRRRRSSRGASVPWLLSAPALLLLFAYHFIPVASGTLYAFTDWTGSGEANFTGLENFRNIITDPTLRGALWHTLLLAFSFLVVVNAVGLCLALGLNRTLKSRRFLRALYYAPSAVSPLAVGFIWQYIFTYDGALNRLLTTVGLGSWAQSWIGSPTFALWTILVVMVWQLSGLTMVIYLAGLQGISDDLYEAAAVDGVSAWRQFYRVTLPLLASSITISATLTLVTGLRVFDQVFALTGGGPVDATETLATQVYERTFVFGQFGPGAALALVLTIVIAVLGFVQLAVLRRREGRQS